MNGILSFLMDRFKDYVDAAAAEGWIRLEHIDFETHLLPVDPENYPELSLDLFKGNERAEGQGRGEVAAGKPFGYQDAASRSVPFDANDSPIFVANQSSIFDDSQSVDTVYSPIRFESGCLTGSDIFSSQIQQSRRESLRDLRQQPSLTPTRIAAGPGDLTPPRSVGLMTQRPQFRGDTYGSAAVLSFPGGDSPKRISLSPDVLVRGLIQPPQDPTRFRKLVDYMKREGTGKSFTMSSIGSKLGGYYRDIGLWSIASLMVRLR
jgi:hypothetical protein